MEPPFGIILWADVIQAKCQFQMGGGGPSIISLSGEGGTFGDSPSVVISMGVQNNITNIKNKTSCLVEAKN